MRDEYVIQVWNLSWIDHNVLRGICKDAAMAELNHQIKASGRIWRHVK